METKDKLQMIEEIKRMERELYLKRSKLASAEAMEYKMGETLLMVGEGLNAEKWKEALSELIRLIGMHSTGGDSVEDIRKERER